MFIGISNKAKQRVKPRIIISLIKTTFQKSYLRCSSGFHKHRRISVSQEFETSFCKSDALETATIVAVLEKSFGSKMMKLTLLMLLLLAYVHGRHTVKKSHKEEEKNNVEEGKNEAENDDPDKRFVIMPGTKWCGGGNNAESDDDLGRYKDLDSCCRSHDKCKRKVESFSKDYGYFNYNIFTVSDCECDEKFYKCMKSCKEHPQAASIVGNLYFNTLEMPCLKFNDAGTKAEKSFYKSW